MTAAFFLIWETSMSSRTKDVSLKVTFLITFILCMVQVCRLFCQHFFFHILRCFVKKTKNLSEQTPCWADCQENTIPSSFAIRGINNLKKLLKLMVLLVYPLKDLIPNSTAILSYKFIMKQFSFRVCHHVKHQFKHS